MLCSLITDLVVTIGLSEYVTNCSVALVGILLVQLLLHQNSQLCLAGY